MKTFFKKFKFWLPAIYLFILIIDLEVMLDLSSYQFLVWFASPPAWINFFQSPNFVIAIILSFPIWFFVGFGIDGLVDRIKNGKKTSLTK